MPRKPDNPSVSQMKAGDLSNVIKESDGLHIVKLVQKEPSRQMSFEEAKVDIENKLMLPIMNKRKAEWENALKKNAKIEIIQDKLAMPEKENKGRNQ
jgi:peptidyl-prolyl cis-trans isomerase C